MSKESDNKAPANPAIEGIYRKYPVIKQHLAHIPNIEAILSAADAKPNGDKLLNQINAELGSGIKGGDLGLENSEILFDIYDQLLEHEFLVKPKIVNIFQSLLKADFQKKSKSINNIQSAKLASTFGIEVEYYGIPKKYEKLLEAACNAKPFEWNFTEDCTIDPFFDVDAEIDDANMSDGKEAVSPILRTNEDLTRAWEVVHAIRSLGGKVNDSCGLHVHVGIVDNLTKQERPELRGLDMSDSQLQLEILKRFTINYYKDALQGGLDKALRNSFYARSAVDLYPNVQKLVEAINNAKSLAELDAAANPGKKNDRYWLINFKSLVLPKDDPKYHGTIELRQHDGSVDPDRIMDWVMTINQYMSAAIGVVAEKARMQGLDKAKPERKTPSPQMELEMEQKSRSPSPLPVEGMPSRLPRNAGEHLLPVVGSMHTRAATSSFVEKIKAERRLPEKDDFASRVRGTSGEKEK